MHIRHFTSMGTARTLVAIAALGLTLNLSSTALAETSTFDSAGVPLHVVDEGNGETIVLLHGFAGSSDLWAAAGLMPLEGFRTIAFDARGHGRSGKPEASTDYGTALVDDVIRLMDARGVDAAHIVGYSMGAETALRLVTAHPDRVLSVVAAGSGWSGATEAQTYGFIASTLAEVDSFGAFMAAMAPPDQELPADAQAAMMGVLTAHGIDPAQASAPLAAAAAGLPEIISIEATALEAISVPVLGIAGANDPERANVEALAEAIPAARVTVIEAADHLTAPLAPAFAAAITDFLAD